VVYIYLIFKKTNYFIFFNVFLPDFLFFDRLGLGENELLLLFEGLFLFELDERFLI